MEYIFNVSPLYFQLNIEKKIISEYIVHGQGLDKDPKGIFSIDTAEGSIYVHGKVDYEKYKHLTVSSKKYSLIWYYCFQWFGFNHDASNFHASKVIDKSIFHSDYIQITFESGEKSPTLVVDIEILDVNDHAPVFNNLVYETTIHESTPQGIGSNCTPIYKRYFIPTGPTFLILFLMVFYPQVKNWLQY